MNVRPLLSAVAIVGAAVLAPPAYAADPLEQTLGLTPGLYSKGQLAHIAAFGDESPAEIQSILGNPMGPLAEPEIAQTDFAMPDAANAKMTLRLASVSIKVAPDAH